MGEEEQNQYLILETLGKGHMAFVFLAYHQQKLTALKMSYQGQEEDDIFSTVKKAMGNEYKKYFLSPIGKAVKIDTFYLGGITPGNQFFFDQNIFVTSWEPADATLLEKTEETFETKLKGYQQFLQGLSIIHTRDRVHLDIKLANLFIVGNRLKIGDFEFYTKIEEFKKSDIICGTPGHMAPEMFYDPENITAKVDIFSAGIAFARLFTGRRFQGALTLTDKEESDM